jgi:hypothetical protein
MRTVAASCFRNRPPRRSATGCGTGEWSVGTRSSRPSWALTRSSPRWFPAWSCQGSVAGQSCERWANGAPMVLGAVTPTASCRTVADHSAGRSLPIARTPSIAFAIMPSFEDILPSLRKLSLSAKVLKPLEVRAGIEPAYADLQSAASPLCHRTGQAKDADISGEPPSRVKSHATPRRLPPARTPRPWHGAAPDWPL